MSTCRDDTAWLSIRAVIYTPCRPAKGTVEIVRCLLQEPTLLILDGRPRRSRRRRRRVFLTLRRLAAEGCSIPLYQPQLDEILALYSRDRASRGEGHGSRDPRQETSSSLAKMMIGGELPHSIIEPPLPAVTAVSVPASRLRRTISALIVDTSFGRNRRIAGVSGNGQKELLAALSGERTVDDAGAVVVNGTPAGRLDAGERRALGLAFVPEERLGRGAVPEMSLADNALLTAWRQELTHRGAIRTGAMRAYATAVIARFNVKASGPESIARSLSGGNLQKFIVGREMLQGPRAMIAAQPTWGVDVGASAQIRQALIDLRDEGVAVLVVSEELDELLEICDRIAVMASGRLSAARPARESDAETIGQMMSGSFIGADEAQPGSRTGVFANAVAPRTIDAP